jgi:DNA-binding NarL/FixJ family response regulator
MPRLHRDILTDLMRVQPGIEVVGSGSHAELTESLVRDSVDLVILGEGVTEHSLSARQLLLQYPNLKVVTIASEGRLANIFEIRQVTLIDPSPELLIQALKKQHQSRDS